MPITPEQQKAIDKSLLFSFEEFEILKTLPKSFQDAVFDFRFEKYFGKRFGKKDGQSKETINGKSS